jgi:hypothetical protein
LLTVARLGAELVHEIVRPVSVAPLASRVTAVSVVPAPTAIEAVPGVTATLATAAGVGTTGTGSLPPPLQACSVRLQSAPATNGAYLRRVDRPM